MTDWDERKERNERHLFVSRRLDMAPPITAVALIFAGTWLCAWAVSAALVAKGMHSMPLRYAVAFAGTVVRGMGKQSMLGNWASALLRKTWWMALLVMALLSSFAATMQNAAPEAKTIAQAYKSIKAKQPK
jgi:hypothetical protein